LINYVIPSRKRHCIALRHYVRRCSLSLSPFSQTHSLSISEIDFRLAVSNHVAAGLPGISYFHFVKKKKEKKKRHLSSGNRFTRRPQNTYHHR